VGCDRVAYAGEPPADRHPSSKQGGRRASNGERPIGLHKICAAFDLLNRPRLRPGIAFRLPDVDLAHSLRCCDDPALSE
jgi:hypothetical protein